MEIEGKLIIDENAFAPAWYLENKKLETKVEKLQDAVFALMHTLWYTEVIEDDRYRELRTKMEGVLD
jgi:hypothetical protein